MLYKNSPTSCVTLLVLPTNHRLFPIQMFDLQKAQTAYHDVSYHVVSNLIIPPK